MRGQGFLVVQGTALFGGGSAPDAVLLVCRPKDGHAAQTAQARQTALAALTWCRAAS